MSMWWDLSLRTAGWGKLLTRPPELSDSPTSRDILERVGEMHEESRILYISI
jgi:hypothetical protein